MQQLYMPLVVGLSLTVAGLGIHTLMDPVQNEISYQLTDVETAEGEAVVLATSFCTSNSQFWHIAGIVWQFIWLLCSALLCFVACRETEDLNGAKNLAVLVVSHFMFLILRFAVYLSGGGTSSTAVAYESMIASLDCVCGVLIYVVPKLFDTGENHHSDEPLPDLFLNTVSELCLCLDCNVRR